MKKTCLILAMLLFWFFYGNGVHNIKFGKEAFGWMDGPMNPSNPLINPLNPTNPMNPMNDSINPLYSDESEQNTEQEQGMEQGRSRTNSGNKKKKVWIHLDTLDIIIILSPFLLFAFIPFIMNAYHSKQAKRIAEFEEKFSKSQSQCKSCRKRKNG